MEREVTIINRLGLHARAAAKLVQLASGYSADLRVCRGERVASAKSIMGVMMLAAAQGTTLRLMASGDDAAAALDALEALIAARFGESQ